MNEKANLMNHLVMGSSGCGRAWHCNKPINLPFPDQTQTDAMIVLLMKEVLNKRTYGNLAMLNPVMPMELRKVRPGETFPQKQLSVGLDTLDRLLNITFLKNHISKNNSPFWFIGKVDLTSRYRSN